MDGVVIGKGQEGLVESEHTLRKMLEPSDKSECANQEVVQDAAGWRCHLVRASLTCSGSSPYSLYVHAHEESSDRPYCSSEGSQESSDHRYQHFRYHSAQSINVVRLKAE